MAPATSRTTRVGTHATGAGEEGAWAPGGQAPVRRGEGDKVDRAAESREEGTRRGAGRMEQRIGAHRGDSGIVDHVAPHGDVGCGERERRQRRRVGRTSRDDGGGESAGNKHRWRIAHVTTPVYLWPCGHRLAGQSHRSC